MRIGAMNPILRADGTAKTIPVAGAVTVRSRAFDISKDIVFGLHIKADSETGTPDIKVELEEGNALPATEGSEETTKFVEPDGFDDLFAQINDKLAHIKTVAPIPMKYARLKITGINANPPDTIVTAEMFIQEEA